MLVHLWTHRSHRDSTSRLHIATPHRDSTDSYLENFEEREEGGTPDIVGAIRCGLVFQLKEAVGGAVIKRQEEALRYSIIQIPL
jgi:selenocysteine lyase/cysteine desulfurase